MGCTEASTGTSRDNRSKSSSDNEIRDRPAIAIRWMYEFVDPPSASTVRIASS